MFLWLHFIYFLMIAYHFSWILEKDHACGLLHFFSPLGGLNALGAKAACKVGPILRNREGTGLTCENLYIYGKLRFFCNFLPQTANFSQHRLWLEPAGSNSVFQWPLLRQCE